jgi:hypothetical protein
MLNALRVLYLITHLKEIILTTKTLKFIHLDPMTFKYDELAFALCIIFYNVIQQFLIQNIHLFKAPPWVKTHKITCLFRTMLYVIDIQVTIQD